MNKTLRIVKEVKPDKGPDTRKVIAKKIRFNIFKRDGFQCQYCGSVPPTVILEIDHINPVSNGGTNDIDNLITACFDCNRGKSSVLLTSIPATIVEKAELIAEKLEQVKAYERLIRARKRYEEKQVQEVQDVFDIYIEGHSFSQSFKQSIRVFLRTLPLDTVTNAMHIACAKFPSANQFNNGAKYFCGICWKIIRELKEKNNGTI
jgi:5-methylcytosine-specific restriction endonuclease McrA